MSRLFAWLRRKIKRPVKHDKEFRDQEVDILDDLPLLQPRQHRVLTPSASEENVNFGSSFLPSSPFFTRLSPEIRLQIYTEAFGNRTVHMDLQHNYIERELYAEKLHADSSFRRESRTHKGWYWWSSECHRIPGYPFLYDRCREGGGVCELFPGKWPEHCFIGVLGWLTTCRQAYRETIDLLYRTNTIHINGVLLPCWLPRLIPSQRLSAISSLELVWDLYLLDPSQSVSEPSRSNWQRFRKVLESIPISFPALKRLELSIDTNAYMRFFPDQGLEAYEENLLKPLDSMVEAFHLKLDHCMIALSFLLHSKLMDQAVLNNAVIEDMVGGGALRRQFWRAVRESSESSKELGYWISEGVELPITDVCCFGSPRGLD